MDYKYCKYKTKYLSLLGGSLDSVSHSRNIIKIVHIALRLYNSSLKLAKTPIKRIKDLDKFGNIIIDLLNSFDEVQKLPSNKVITPLLNNMKPYGMPYNMVYLAYLICSQYVDGLYEIKYGYNNNKLSKLLTKVENIIDKLTQIRDNMKELRRQNLKNLKNILVKDLEHILNKKFVLNYIWEKQTNDKMPTTEKVFPNVKINELKPLFMNIKTNKQSE